MALALALRVWPITLLMPDTETGDHAVTATGLPKSVTAEEFWDWLTASDGLYDHGGNEWVETAHMGHPHWKVRSHYESAYRDFRNTVQGLRREGVDLDHLAAALRDDEHGDD
ncbi:hypothetical protein AWC11_01625 [Mycobacterium interjectum]|nr:hypothetical protein AWC11_01625 [Mycobacterium interjectum]